MDERATAKKVGEQVNLTYLSETKSTNDLKIPEVNQCYR